MSPLLDPHTSPPASLQTTYKLYRKLKDDERQERFDYVDFNIADLPLHLVERRDVASHLTADRLESAFNSFAGTERACSNIDAVLYEFKQFDGLIFIPSLLPIAVQRHLLSTLLHRDLSNPAHLTNVHAHHHISYPSDDTSEDRGGLSHSSFFIPSEKHALHLPKDPSIHKSITNSQLLNKKLRWMTLGGQYDWTAKVYPVDDKSRPTFPADTATLLRTLFPSTTPEAAICNVYSPGDSLSLHRDVAEASSAPLISISMGCDAIFVVGLQDPGEDAEVRSVALRLRSGDAVVMGGESRWAWHGIAQTIGGTCPKELEDWPAGEEDAFEDWRGWMSSKRVNLNVRQMYREVT